MARFRPASPVHNKTLAVESHVKGLYLYPTAVAVLFLHVLLLSLFLSSSFQFFSFAFLYLYSTGNESQGRQILHYIPTFTYILSMSLKSIFSWKL